GRGAVEKRGDPLLFERGGAPTLAAAGWKKFSPASMSAWLPRAEGLRSSRRQPLGAICGNRSPWDELRPQTHFPSRRCADKDLKSEPETGQSIFLRLPRSSLPSFAAVLICI